MASALAHICLQSFALMRTLTLAPSYVKLTESIFMWSTPYLVATQLNTCQGCAVLMYGLLW
ncbi:MAG: hypothetical protein AT711_00950 [Thermoproteus sp. CIS_19]|nr:MAG: hypothetical protein AT711_00950 [Thermoproteus sp. CIS_19]